MRIVCCDERRSLRLASCCSVDVMNGGGGLQPTLLVEVAPLRNAAAVDGGEPRIEGSGVERADDVPVAGGHEAHALALALDDQACRHGLHPAGREALHDLPPED